MFLYDDKIYIHNSKGQHLTEQGNNRGFRVKVRTKTRRPTLSTTFKHCIGGISQLAVGQEKSSRGIIMGKEEENLSFFCR